MACCCGHPALVHERTGPSRTGDGACREVGCDCRAYVALLSAAPRGSGAAASSWPSQEQGERRRDVPAVGPRHITTRRAGRTVHEDPYTGTEVDL